MEKHVKIYMKHFDIGESDIWQCEACTKQLPFKNMNVHHIQGRGKNKDVIENLMCLCQDKCHAKAHGTLHPVSKDEFQLIHNNFLIGNRKVFIK